MNPILVFGLLAAGGVVLNKRASSDYRAADRLWDQLQNRIRSWWMSPAGWQDDTPPDLLLTLRAHQDDYRQASGNKDGARMLAIASSLAIAIRANPAWVPPWAKQ